MNVSYARKCFTLLLTGVMAFWIMAGASAADKYGRPIIGITWSQDNANVEAIKRDIKRAGGVPVLLGQVKCLELRYKGNGKLRDKYLEPSGRLKSEYEYKVIRPQLTNTNVNEVLAGVDGVFFANGCNIAPSIYDYHWLEEQKLKPQPARDLSNSIIMDYCCNHDFPAFTWCDEDMPEKGDAYTYRFHLLMGQWKDLGSMAKNVCKHYEQYRVE